MKRLTFLLLVLLLFCISLTAFHSHGEGIGHPSCLLCMVSLFLPAPEPGLTDSGAEIRPDASPVPDSTFLPAPPGTTVHLDRAPPSSTRLQDV